MRVTEALAGTSVRVEKGLTTTATGGNSATYAMVSSVAVVVQCTNPESSLLLTSYTLQFKYFGVLIVN